MRDGPVLVVGGGLLGLSCAWFLRDAGLEVVVLEAGEPGGGASRGNAGAICPSLTEPLPAPGMLRTAMRDLTKPEAALHVHPAYAPRMAGFLRRFARAATRERYDAGLRALVQLSTRVTGAFDHMAAAGIGTHARRDGYLCVYSSEVTAAAEHAHVRELAALGVCSVPGGLLDAAQARVEEPLLGGAATAAFVVPDERWIDASRFVDDLAAGVRAAGATLIEDSPASSVSVFDDGVEVETPTGRYDGASVVLAAGIWTKALTDRLGLRLSLLPGKGYSFSVRPPTVPSRLLYLADAHVVAAPLGGRLRIGGTMEFDGTTDRFRPGRIDAIVRGVGPLLPGVDLTAREDEWVGPRPITPDGLPYIGRVPGHPRAVVATGHNMLGLTLGPVTGQVVAGLIANDDPGVDLAPFDPGR